MDSIHLENIHYRQRLCQNRFMVTIYKDNFSLESLIAASADDAVVANMLHNSTWRLGEEASWHLDQNSGQLLLTFDDGSFALAPAQIVGSYHHNDSSFLWAWDHPSVLPGLAGHAMNVRNFGREQKSSELTKGRILCTEQRAWELTALAMRLGQAKGTYRVMIKPDVSLFLTFGEVQLAQEADTPTTHRNT